AAFLFKHNLWGKPVFCYFILKRAPVCLAAGALLLEAFGSLYHRLDPHDDPLREESRGRRRQRVAGNDVAPQRPQT
ncbi:hypothetical protein NKH14_22255, partial [Mesorhizobium sp. M1380]|uniref:hypothetical protein n=1 Tax=Mesorhizobium sp. M1380 TaxID=2957093 RepID=UPI00333A611B